MNALSRALTVLAFSSLGAAQTPAPAAAPRHNVIIFVADGLRRGSVNAEDTPTLYRIRTEGVDLRNSHSVYPTVTTANASAIATGHGLGDTGDFGNVIYPGVYLTQPHTPGSAGYTAPFLENDDVLATLNGFYDGSYLGETTLLSAAHDAGMNVAAIGKLGPVAIQMVSQVNRDELGLMKIPSAIIVDDTTGYPGGIPLPLDFSTALVKSGLPTEAPLRTNSFSDASMWSNGFAGDGMTPGTRAPNLSQMQWFTDVTTQLVLPGFAAENKPFVVLLWARDPDGTQHNQGDSFQSLTPGINGETSKAGVRNADRSLSQVMEWLDKHPEVKANTDVIVTSDHGFATISRRETDAHGTLPSEPSAALTYVPGGHDKAEPPHTLPNGFLAIDLALYQHLRVFDPVVRSTTGDSAYAEVPLSGETAHYPLGGSALLGDSVTRLDGSDAQLIVAANGGSDLIYVPTKNAEIVKQTIDTLSQLDYVDGIFVDDAYCPSAGACPGALPLSAVGLKGSTHLPTPAIVVSFKSFYLTPGDLQSGILIADTNLQEGQGNHGSLARDQTWNNMAAIGPDFKKGFVDADPVGNIDIAPTAAALLGLQIAPHGSIAGRVMGEALGNAVVLPADAGKTLVSAPAANGRRTVLDYQEHDGTRYFDRACMAVGSKPTCNE